ncbi:N-acetyl-gamma-glutamyl-phosphate reductase [Haloferax volcanii]|uniref:Putative [LysW]-L-2-aminoadipate/[LysW]-L-glutamate phosphate reductase n=3 Tax=Haloferax volcanii TaxID=2246 RepID=A0A558G977_HALVO|nr:MULTISPECIES: N-acetyl-gamma-glutamyl-phosphate reductase [Haloferax]ELK50565.1 N-acetyl-gamma-glutamyl-phosphate reductase [Haloferax sp. BAB-2207]ELZ70293.1 N-acetyl-gamma-glutamyl-phosphate reductase [Haloferax lucentense DSM 14919]ELZ90817.1 N-acetyl-gamma-glutamyl-phosphate reductase [Haloferax alexandrinus JCM 10717]NLV01086.1 N-acetyl-gamma-glutamyl-phosphate reductase [Haloferax alexandrinus]TVT94286.1 N-acetyl-gamma-glutamyl-phosphate reductase [Haloferax volcanii]
MSDQLTAGVVGGSGFTGGELLRLLDGHPNFEVEQATSRSYERKTVGHVHPNLRHLDLRFTSPEDLESVDVLFTATPHGVSMEHIDAFQDAADTVVDLSADFRLSEAAQYDEWYDGHVCPEYLEKSEYALPELNRENLPGADLIAAGGCNATATILGLKPLFDAGILAGDEQVVVDVKVGSSEGGAGASKASSHAERSGIVRPYAPTGHRHEAEIEEYLGLSVSFTVHAVDMVRGAAATCHVFPDDPVSKGDMWKAFRGSYGDEPFVRTVAGGGGVYRYPEPKSVAGTNYGEVGFEVDPGNRRLVVFSAIDNMMKGSAGQAVHAANIALGLDETAGLDFTGFHPVGSP